MKRKIELIDVAMGLMLLSVGYLVISFVTWGWLEVAGVVDVFDEDEGPCCCACRDDEP